MKQETYTKEILMGKTKIYVIEPDLSEKEREKRLQELKRFILTISQEETSRKS
ncbi:hypothetical protein IC619_000810 [Hazenella sp. IB182353]|uniref:hypothetical protein n=1 Tax=Polycladospora coralii TaxID=2771432 RepID=UPI001746A083|nr:hypothetical protein [Polycladospora coralii]MBS7529032.1 hypothetical protein [Polycladospora coralii]